MPLERVAGRLRSDQLGFPAECPALVCSALPGCDAELRGKRCQLCVRTGDLPLPGDWYGCGWVIVGTHSVQVVRDHGAWAVVCFLPHRLVNPRFPPIRVRTKPEALDYAHLRAAQLRPGKRIIPKRSEPETWQCGDLLIWVAPSA